MLLKQITHKLGVFMLEHIPVGVATDAGHCVLNTTLS